MLIYDRSENEEPGAIAVLGQMMGVTLLMAIITPDGLGRRARIDQAISNETISLSLGSGVIKSMYSATKPAAIASTVYRT